MRMWGGGGGKRNSLLRVLRGCTSASTPLGHASLLFCIPLAGHSNCHVQPLICHLLLPWLSGGIFHPDTNLGFPCVHAPPLRASCSARQATPSPEGWILYLPWTGAGRFAQPFEGGNEEFCVLGLPLNGSMLLTEKPLARDTHFILHKTLEIPHEHGGCDCGLPSGPLPATELGTLQVLSSSSSQHQPRSCPTWPRTALTLTLTWGQCLEPQQCLTHEQHLTVSRAA